MRLKVSLSVGAALLKSTVSGRKTACVREKLQSSFLPQLCKEGVCSYRHFFRIYTKKEGHGVHRESLGQPAPQRNLVLHFAQNKCSCCRHLIAVNAASKAIYDRFKGCISST